MIGGKDLNNIGSLSNALLLWTDRSSLGLSLLLIEYLGIPLTIGMARKARLKNPWEGKVCRGFGRSTRLTLHFLAMSITMKELVQSIRYGQFQDKYHIPFLLKLDYADYDSAYFLHLSLEFPNY